MKKFTTLKVGYSAGVYGCSAEYFNTIIIDGDRTYSVAHQGMYGSEERVNSILKNAGYDYFYVPTDFGKIGKRDAWKGFKDEYEAIEDVDHIIKHGEHKDQF